MRTLTAILIALALAAAGCGGDDEGGGGGGGGPASPEQVVKRWMLEGECDLMTDKFLEAQLLGLGKGRQDRCELFEKQHTKPQYGEDDIQITDVKVTGNRASLVVGSENAPDIKSKYDLVKAGGQWRIDAAELQ
ncbi:MAG: hypothetical protein M3340_15980 [Actinomycetota bacterium]|nr:hypothetical protein [Actinomycetota bacterium]